MNTKQFSLNYKDKTYQILINKKRIKSLRLKIDRDLKIQLNIPLFYSYEKAIDFINNKANWIAKNLDKLEEKTTPTCTFTNGEKLTILGIERTLLISPSKKNDVELFDDTLSIMSRNLDPIYISKLFYKWAVGYFYGHLLDMYEIVYKKFFKKLNIHKPQIVLKKMKSMWGNCKYNKEIITFNFYLFKTPVECVEYVILHELTHMIYHDHGANFKAFLTKNMPDWKERKKQLNKYSLSF